MSRRGIHPLLRGLDRPQRVAPSRHAVLLSDLESAQRKRYLRSDGVGRRASGAHILVLSLSWKPHYSVMAPLPSDISPG